VKLNAVSSNRTDPFVHKHQGSVATLQASATLGCYICASFWRCISEKGLDSSLGSCEGPATTLLVYDSSIIDKDTYMIQVFAQGDTAQLLGANMDAQFLLEKVQSKLD
jgi:hypothetical protein